MEKTRIGITAGLFGASMYLGAEFLGYIVLILLAGYVLLFEQNQWLRKTAVKAVALTMGFLVLAFIIELIPNAIGIVDDLYDVFGKRFPAESILALFDFIEGIVVYIREILFVLLAVKALKMEDVAVGPIDKLIAKHM